ncbi:MAG: ABC transporter ATP-binding protein/permease [Oscillatoriaceae bacterium SKW80]|nr:ABC transporter ATP-binding protein/permease [Oscillatoriaceae bacterium SKYG93]MCX8122479.1 ABC transporter ATP-binding protein/permease [Oscillatoriaceae bacterium SKW80]MDW8452581.1 ABC transporter ATP-binding protein/permease [Oscillatoriaceae cyanobacterium SKYGB_i_bin93]HIK27344.1 ABC transporter ATP-binding protein/permease [Oscillatoriaceae cyanobacterium M7585_C2015_266]
MSAKKIILKFARQYPFKIILTIILGLSGAVFNGVSTTLIVPIILSLLNKSLDLQGAPNIIKWLMFPFAGLAEDYRLIIMTLAIVVAIALKNIASYASLVVSSALTRSLTADLRKAGVRLLLDVDLDYFAKMKVGDLINRLGAEVNRTATAIGTLIQIVITAITVLVFVCLLLAISWQLTLASTLLLSVVVIVNQYAIALSKFFGKQLSEASTAYSVRLMEMLNGIRLVKATGSEEKEYEQLQRLITVREKADFRCEATYGLIAPVTEVTSIIALLAIVFLGRIFFAEEVEALSAVLLTYLLVLFRLLPLVSQINGARSQLANTTASVESVYDFLRRDNKPFMKNGSIPYKKLREGIRFHHVSFAYPGHSELVLRDINLFLPYGTTLALVGSSGAGKSTLADLLPRFYDPTSGCILIDGIDVRQFDIKTLRNAMGIVSQETFLFNDTVRNNIAYARPEATEEEIIEAAQRANALEFIEELPQGLETIIGDRGVLLSGGQRQRIAIARALLQNPEILILDEATSALDTVSERLVQLAIEELSRDRTTLVIAHRLSTIQKAHQIAVLDRGQVVEIGSHEELLRKGGYYTRLYSMQFLDETNREKALVKASYEVRSRLNPMIGFLKLLVDNMVDSQQEREELIKESYHAATRILKILELIENSVRLHQPS